MVKLVLSQGLYDSRQIRVFSWALILENLAGTWHFQKVQWTVTSTNICPWSLNSENVIICIVHFCWVRKYLSLLWLFFFNQQPWFSLTKEEKWDTHHNMDECKCDERVSLNSFKLLKAVIKPQELVGHQSPSPKIQMVHMLLDSLLNKTQTPHRSIFSTFLSIFTKI